MTLGDFDEIADRWKEEAGVSSQDNEHTSPEWNSTPKPISSEELDKLIAREKAYAESTRGSPLR